MRGGFEDWCNEHGIVIETTPPYSSSANGVAERGIRTVIEQARSLLKAADLPPKYWCDAVAAAVELGNFVPVTRNPGITPFEAFSKHRPDISHLRAYGCIAYMKIPTKSLSWGGKLAYQSRETQLIGYFGRGAYKLLDRSTGKVYKSRDVISEERTPHRSKLVVPK